MSAGAKLRSSGSADIELLTALLHDLKADRDDNLTCSRAFIGLFAVQNVLAEVLGLPNASSPEVGGQESEPDLGSQSFQDSASDVNDETWTEEWDPESLYRWMLDEIRGLEPENVTPRLALSSDTGALPDVLSSLTDDGSPSIGREEEDLDIAVSCPISFLPVELLRNIFHFALSHRSQIRLPLTLSHINSYFRSVTLRMASLWTTIDDFLPMSIVELYIARSGEEPLQIRMSAEQLAHVSPPQRHQRLDILSKESKRVQSIELHGVDPSAFSTCAELLDERRLVFSSLVKLELVVSSWGRPGTQDANCLAWRCFPSLQDLWIQGYRLESWASPSDPLPSCLRRLKLSNGRLIELEDLLNALQSLVNLNILSLDTCSLDFSAIRTRNHDGITMTCLENLEVARMIMEEIMGLASFLDTPNLLSFSIIYPGYADRSLARFLIPFTKTHSRLCSLIIQGCKMKSEAWSSVLEHSVHLNHLVIRASGLRDEDLRALGTAATVPNVTHLTLENELYSSRLGFNVSEENAEVIARLVPHVRIEAIGKLRDGCEGDSGSEEDGWDNSYWEGSDFSDDGGWLSGDEAIRTQSESFWKLGAFTYTSY